MSIYRIVTLALIVLITLVTVYTGRTVFRALMKEELEEYSAYKDLDAELIDLHAIPRKVREEL